MVASEILYYLSPAQLTRHVRRARASVLRPGGRLVAVHWRPAGPERPFTAAEVHARCASQPWLRPVRRGGTPDYLLDVLERA